MLRSIKTNQRLERELAFLVTGTGTAAITVGADLATLVDNSTGNYTLTYAKPFARQPVVVGTTATDVTTLRIVTSTASAVNIECVGADQTTATDAVFHLIVKGWDTSEEYAEPEGV